MEQALEARLEQDREIIHAVTQQEMRKLLLRNKLAALRNSRGRLTEETRMVDDRGNAVRGRRKLQEFYVTEKDVTRRVMRRLKFPKEELARLEAEEEEEAAAAGATGTIGVEETKEEPLEDECLMVGEEDDEMLDPTEFVQLAKPKISDLSQVRPIRVVQPAAPPVVESVPAKKAKMDDIDRAVAELNRMDKAKAKKGQAKKGKTRKGRKG